MTRLARGMVFTMVLAACDHDVPGQGPRPTAGPVAPALRSSPDASLASAPAPAARANRFPDLSEVVARVRSCVVNISAERTSEAPSSRFFSDPLYRRFFGQPFRPEEEHRKSLGSGVVASEDGDILTNGHLVQGAGSIWVELPGQRRYQARVVGIDRPSDLALLHVEASGLRTLAFADSTLARAGDLVLALGNPFGVGQTVTMGIVSGIRRADVGIADYEDFIQTDAAINPGNSGGALVDMQSQLLGINTAILSRTGGNLGIGFAIPSNMVSSVLRALKTRGRVSRGWLGAQIEELTRETARSLRLPADTQGVVVTAVDPQSPAARAGLQPGDVIVSLEGRPIESAGHLRNAVARLGPGRRVDLMVLRGGRPVRLTPLLQELPAAVTPTGFPAPEPILRGITVSGLDEDGGVVVTGIVDSSPAAEFGLQPGDVILSVNRRPVHSRVEFTRLARNLTDRVLLRVRRDGRLVNLAW